MLMKENSVGSSSSTTVDHIKATIIPILQQHGATRAGIFGSLVRGEGRPDSDVDLLVEFGPGLSLLDVERINQELEEALGRKVDLVEYEAIKSRIKDRILAEEVRIL